MGFRKRLALILLFCVITVPFCGMIYAAASETAPEACAGAAAENAAQPEAETAAPETAALYVDGIRVGDCLLLGGRSYVDPALLCKALCRDAETFRNTETETLTVWWDGLWMTLRAGDDYFTANNRYFYVQDGIRVSDGTLRLPIRDFLAAFALEPEWDGESWAVIVESTGLTLPVQTQYNETDLYWLSRIIHAESGNQPLGGRIGVGNVVLNRVRSESCPDSVYEVIFDRRYGVQFTPAATGTIYAEPDALSVIAAKLCLDGCNVVGESLYFLNPAIGASGWFTRTRSYVVTIGEHAFYA